MVGGMKGRSSFIKTNQTHQKEPNHTRCHCRWCWGLLDE